MKKLLMAATIIAALSSCSSTQLVHISVLEPAAVTIPKDVKNVAVLNRSIPGKQNKVIDAVDKIFTLEGPNLDREGGIAGINGLMDELLKNKRFEFVNNVTNNTYTTTGTGVISNPLDWNEVSRICAENNAQLLFALEVFDTDSKVSYAANQVSINTPLGKVPAIEHRATMQTFVKTIWRIYDPSSKTILDESPMATNLSYYGKGINPVIAAGALIDRKEAVKQVANRVGQYYALRIIPNWERVTRDYFVKGTDNFDMARRKANSGNWDGAAALWLSETKNSSGKIAGRACYNMAIISEINGDIEQAMKWAQKSYEDYGNKLALRYVNILRYRRQSNEILEQQGGQ
ncbi:MAG: hypothetical protein H7Y27_02275 [Gemmatimonadaceae bacterium]|nr:hypothetical protein [Chitinophagaceae bacterium]